MVTVPVMVPLDSGAGDAGAGGTGGPGDGLRPAMDTGTDKATAVATIAVIRRIRSPYCSSAALVAQAGHLPSDTAAPARWPGTDNSGPADSDEVVRRVSAVPRDARWNIASVGSHPRLSPAAAAPTRGGAQLPGDLVHVPVDVHRTDLGELVSAGIPRLDGQAPDAGRWAACTSHTLSPTASVRAGSSPPLCIAVTKTSGSGFDVATSPPSSRRPPRRRCRGAGADWSTSSAGDDVANAVVSPLPWTAATSRRAPGNGRPRR